MMDWISLTTIGLAFFIIAISPGPANISNAAVAMSLGRKVSLVYGAGLSSGLIVWGLVAASGLGAALQTSVHLLILLKVLGGLYLIWLAFISLKSVTSVDVTGKSGETKTRSYASWFIKGMILNISNPKTVVAWMAALSVGLSPEASLTQLSAGVLVCVLVGFVCNAFYSLCFSLTIIRNGYVKLHKYLNTAFAAIYTMAGFGLIKSAFNRNEV